MSLQKYRKVKYLGKGSYGAAILVQLRSNPKQTFVIKEIVIGHLKEAEKQSAKTEVEVLKQMTHSNITMYIESFVEASKLYIVMEHADGGDLSAAITRRKTLGQNWPEDEVMRIFVQICLALKHVHDQNILHRDLKSQNIFLTTKGIVKLGDFGIAKVLEATEQQARTQIGTPYYLSPEICESLPYGRNSDIWSLGVVLFELLALELPFQANSLPALVVRICSADPNWNKIEKNYSPKVVDLNKQMLAKKSEKRPSILQIVRSEYIIKHVSQLLSYTLQMGKGGAEAAASGEHLDPEAADRDIERARDMHRKREIEQEKLDREAAIQAQRAEQRAEEREKLRKFRQDMIRRKETSPPKDVVVYAPEAPQHYRQVAARREDETPDTPPRDRERIHNNQRQAEAKHDNHHYHPEPRGHHVVHNYDNEMERHRDEAKAIYMENQRRAQHNRNRAVGHHVGPPSSAAHYHQDSSAVVGGRQPNSSDFESAARMEYFANRAAAQQIKARVEAYERGGQQYLPAVAGAAPSSAGRRYHIEDPADRIAAVKAQRERERNQQLAEQEQQLQAAYEANREERRRLKEKRQREAAAYKPTSDNDNDYDMMEAEYSPADRQRQKERELREREEVMRRAAAEQVEQRRALKKKGKAEAIAFEISFDDDAKSDVSKNKKQEVSRNSESVAPAPAAPRARRGWGAPTVPPAVTAPIEDETPPAEVEEEDHVRALYGTTEAKEIAEDEEVVLRCLEARQDREHDARMHAREVFRKLREKRRKEALKIHAKHNNSSAAQAKPPAYRGGNIDDVMQQISKANAEVKRTVEVAQRQGYKTEESADQVVAEDEVRDEDNEDELERTLDKWLAKKGRRAESKEVKTEEQRERSNTIDDDGEMAGLQCMLANALMGDDAADGEEGV